MDYKKLIKSLKCDGYGVGQDGDGCTSKRCKYRDSDGACNIVSMCEDAEIAITDLLARAEAAEASCKRLDEARERANESAHQWEGRCKILETRLETAEKMVKEYQDTIVPGYRERAEKVEEIASDLCDDFTDFVTGGIHNAAPYCANQRPECVNAHGWCNGDNSVCRGFLPKAAGIKKEE